MATNFFPQNWLPILWKKIDLQTMHLIRSHAVHEISAYGEKCSHRPINGSVLLLISMSVSATAGAQANKLPDSVDAGEPIN